MKIKTIILDNDGNELFTQEMPENSEIELEIKGKTVIITNKVI